MKAPRVLDELAGAEHRQYARVDLDVSVFVSCNGRLYSGRLEDLSTRSIRVRMNAVLPIGQEAEVIIVQDGRQTLVRGEVERRADGSTIISETRKDNEALRALFFASMASQSQTDMVMELELETDDTSQPAVKLTLMK